MRKVLSILLALSLTTGFLPVFAAEYTYAEPKEPELWMEPDFSTDYAYSIALVGDTQCLSRTDYFTGTKYMEQLYGVLSDTAEERKLEHVFVLGDITDMSYRNDKNLGYGQSSPTPVPTGRCEDKGPHPSTAPAPTGPNYLSLGNNIC